ncbi:MAG: TolC family protein, partial [Burkholderiales bacterium]|nr:TolC family protein [Burkholderiales bacterium]
MTHRPELQSLGWELAALGDDAALSRVSVWEPVDAGVDATRDDDWRVGPTISTPIPIYDTGSASRAAAAARIQRARHELSLAKRLVIEEVRTSYATLASSLENLTRVRSTLLPLQESRRQIAEDAYRAGMSDITTLYLAEQDLSLAAVVDAQDGRDALADRDGAGRGQREALESQVALGEDRDGGRRRDLGRLGGQLVGVPSPGQAREAQAAADVVGGEDVGEDRARAARQASDHGWDRRCSRGHARWPEGGQSRGRDQLGRGLPKIADRHQHGDRAPRTDRVRLSIERHAEVGGSVDRDRWTSDRAGVDGLPRELVRSEGRTLQADRAGADRAIGPREAGAAVAGHCGAGGARRAQGDGA